MGFRVVRPQALNPKPSTLNPKPPKSRGQEAQAAHDHVQADAAEGWTEVDAWVHSRKPYRFGVWGLEFRL